MVEVLFAKGGEDKHKLRLESTLGIEECTASSKFSRSNVS